MGKTGRKVVADDLVLLMVSWTTTIVFWNCFGTIPTVCTST